MINIIVTLVAMIFIITKKISKKEKIIENKLDICVLVLCLSSCIPLIFNTYTTLTECINYILKYISAFLIYMIVKNLTKENPRLKTYITNIVIISAVLLVIFGIDKMSTNIFLPLAKAINVPEITYEETRMDSFFSYANTFAAFCSMALFLAIGGYIKAQKGIKKCIYGIAIFLLETGIILSYSRIIFIFLAIVFLRYLILLKNKEHRIKALECTIITGIFADIFKITILEKNKYFDDIKKTEIEFGTYSGEKEISITTTENTTEIFIVFSSLIAKDEMYLKVNKLLINNHEEVLNYKYLSTSLVNKIKNINFNTKSAWERGVFITDALKLVKTNFLFGIGGDGWQYREGEVQSYYYWAR